VNLRIEQQEVSFLAQSIPSTVATYEDDDAEPFLSGFLVHELDSVQRLVVVGRYTGQAAALATWRDDVARVSPIPSR